MVRAPHERNGISIFRTFAREQGGYPCVNSEVSFALPQWTVAGSKSAVGNIEGKFSPVQILLAMIGPPKSRSAAEVGPIAWQETYCFASPAFSEDRLLTCFPPHPREGRVGCN